MGPDAGHCFRGPRRRRCPCDPGRGGSARQGGCGSAQCRKACWPVALPVLTAHAARARRPRPYFSGVYGMGWKTLDDMDLAGKRVLLRVDINVPVENGKVTDATRIERIVPTVEDILSRGGKPVIVAHFGRPRRRRRSSCWRTSVFTRARRRTTRPSPRGWRSWATCSATMRSARRTGRMPPPRGWRI